MGRVFVKVGVGDGEERDEGSKDGRERTRRSVDSLLVLEWVF